MCLWIERAHVRELRKNVTKTLERLRKAAPDRAHDLLFDLPPAVAPVAIIFRDFPKSHGNIIQNAVGIALGHHPGGYTLTSANFKFLSGLAVQVDNFFMAADGQIYLFETKRDQGNIREEGVAGRNLWDVKTLIEDVVRTKTGRELRHPIKLAYFSYADKSFGHGPKGHEANISSKAKPIMVDMPIYSREDMNNLIGHCFGQFLSVIDRLVDTAISNAVPEMTNQARLADTSDVDTLLRSLMDESKTEPFQIGSPPSPRSTAIDDVLASAQPTSGQ